MPVPPTASRATARRLLGVIAGVVALGLSGATATAWAAPDYDGDGSTADDCRPLDAAVHPGAADPPDTTFEDTDCDGVDGSAAQAFWVSTTGNDAGPGTLQAPFRTVGHAILAAAAAAPKKAVYLEVGTYSEHLALVSGVSVYGGYLASGARTRDQASTIAGLPGTQETVVADGARGVELGLLTVLGPTNTSAGSSSYAIRAIAGSSLALTQATVRGGAAGNGNAGAPGTASTVPGSGGWCGGLTSTYTCYLDAPFQNSAFTGGGLGANGPTNARGGNGASGPLTGNGSAGTKGEGTGAGLGGHGGISRLTGLAEREARDGDGVRTAALLPNPCFSCSGGDGGDGAVGADGLAGTPDTFSADEASTTWLKARHSIGGGVAENGSGGGGGGSGQAVHDASCNEDLYGGAGAGGGSGGGGGFGGGPGSPGGGSFGLYLAASAAVIDGGTLAGGSAGAGGAGGDGGVGAAGGAGGTGQHGMKLSGCSGSAYDGGDGGHGGAGGYGGGGGGGAGGPSAAVFATGTSFGASTVTSLGADLSGGAAGAGGPTGAGGKAAATAAPSGPSVAVLSQPGAGSVLSDFDGDGFIDGVDACPAVPRGTADANGDGCPDRPAALADRDADGIPDASDACPDTAAPTCTPAPTPAAGQQSIQSGTATSVLTPTVKAKFTAARTKTTITALTVSGLPAGAAVSLACAGPKKGGCPFSSRKLVVAKGSAQGLKTRTVRVHGRRTIEAVPVAIPVGLTLTVQLTAPGRVGKVLQYLMRARKQPQLVTTCLQPGAASATSC